MTSIKYGNFQADQPVRLRLAVIRLRFSSGPQQIEKDLDFPRIAKNEFEGIHDFIFGFSDYQVNIARRRQGTDTEM